MSQKYNSANIAVSMGNFSHTGANRLAYTNARTILVSGIYSPHRFAFANQRIIKSKGYLLDRTTQIHLLLVHHKFSYDKTNTAASKMVNVSYNAR